MPHIHKLIDFTAEVFIVFNHKVLLRKHDKYKIWLSIGGHIELNEDPNQAVIREAREEVGLNIILDNRLLPVKKEDSTEDLIPPYYLKRNRINDNHEHITFVYFALSDTDNINELVSRERSEECKWFTKEDLLKSKEVLPSIKFYAKKALEKLDKNKKKLLKWPEGFEKEEDGF